MKPDESVDDDLLAMFDADNARCPAWPEQEEGPYHREAAPMRRDVLEDRVGVPLRCALRLSKPDGAPAVGAITEIWHCDALGRYSGFDAPTREGSNRSTTEAETTPDHKMYLRGAQLTDATGTCEFRTIYPGWYPGRTVHIHVRAHHDGQTYTSQLYFAEALTEAVFTQAPYRERPGRDTTNATDQIFANGGAAALLRLEPEDNGYKAVVCFTLDNTTQLGPR